MAYNHQFCRPRAQALGKPSLFSDLKLRDICSHRNGILSLDEITQGLDSRILIVKKDLVQVCNALPIKYDLRTTFLYNNALFALARGIIERVSNHSNWGDFLHDRIFQPLDMSRSTAFRTVHETDTNIAMPYMILTNDHPSKITRTELSADSMNGGSGGIRSSINDLLKWCSCLLQSFHDPDKESLVRHGSSIFNRTTVANPQRAGEGDYCAGWFYHRKPAKLALISPNRMWESLVLDFVGAYVMDHLDVACLDISVNTKDALRLIMVVNKQPDQAGEMWHYNHDTWCHLPDSYTMDVLFEELIEDCGLPSSFRLDGTRRSK